MAEQMEVQVFKRQLQSALQRVETVLGTEKSPQLAANVHHTYQDKYYLTECMTNVAVASQVDTLASLGLSAEQLEQLRAWAAAGSAVSLHFYAEERCAYLREETREEEAPTKHVVEIGPAKITNKVVNKVTEHLWRFDCSYELAAVRGADVERLAVLSRRASDELRTSSRVSPHPEAKVPAADFRVSVTWLLEALGEADGASCAPHFQIDRLDRRCRTPRRNPPVEAALEYFKRLPAWLHQVAGYLEHLFKIKPDISSKLDLGALQSKALVPVLPLMYREEAASESPNMAARAVRAAQAAQGAEAAAGMVVLASPAEPADSLTLPMADMNQLLAEERRSHAEQCAGLRQSFPSGSMLGSAAEALSIVTLRHAAEVCWKWSCGVDYIEDMLREQLLAAIGKEVTPADFAQYMRFHNRQLFADAYVPVPFCFAVRRSGQHGPEGTVSIEQQAARAQAGGGTRHPLHEHPLASTDRARNWICDGCDKAGNTMMNRYRCTQGCDFDLCAFCYGQPQAASADSGIPEPIVTMVAKGERPPPMQFALNASTNITFGGERYLHAWLSHQFSGEPGASLSLVARARQFSSMVVMVGRIASANIFEPKYAAVVQNKDELTIPLDLATIPTPKEFKDAIESLAPQQQAFCKAIRSLQLSSTLFGVLVVQIKPQLEKVLNLAPDSLTKEIKLTQDLMQLFTKYQIPSDLLSYDSVDEELGVERVGASPAERLEAVRAHVRAMQEMLERAKQEEIEERRREAEAERLRLEAQRRAEEEEERRRRRIHEEERHLRMKTEELKGLAREGCVQRASSGTLADSLTSTFSRVKQAAAGAGFSLFSAPTNYSARGERRSLRLHVPEGFCVDAGTSSGQRSAPCSAPPQGQPRDCTPDAEPAEPEAPADEAKRDQDKRQEGEDEGAPVGRDYTKVPQEMDASFERLDSDRALRPTIITPGSEWTKKAQKALLAAPTTSQLGSDAQKREKDSAFDLLDALTKSGALPVEHAALHVVVAATHCFDRTVLETVVQESSNPIERVERSTLIMAATVHERPPAALVREANLPRLQASSPALFGLEDSAGGSADDLGNQV